MGIEIERRFIVKSFEWKLLNYVQEHYYQGYLTSENKNWTIRVRIINQEKSFLTCQ